VVDMGVLSAMVKESSYCTEGATMLSYYQFAPLGLYQWLDTIGTPGLGGDSVCLDV